MLASVFDDAFLGVSHPMLDLGKGLLDRIEVWGIRRQEPEPCTGLADHLPDGIGFMRAEIVHDDDVTRFEHRQELLLDISLEAFTVDWPVEDTRSGQPITAQSAQKGQGAPMAVRGEAAQALAFRSPAA